MMVRMARALYNLLTTRGFRCFLDKESLESVNDLAALVARSRTLIFVLSDSVLESEWCIQVRRASGR